jgi:hypothetical protein
LCNVKGILYRGDALTKYSKPNQPLLNAWRSVRPDELAVVNVLSNEAEASKFMLKAIDFDPNARTTHPSVPSTHELTQFLNPPARHEAYAFMWNSLTYFGVVANSFMWLYL